MPVPSFNIPTYPLQGRFSDPFCDFEGMEDELSTLAAKPPAQLRCMDLYLLFNSFLPAGSFEEMAPYLPHAIALLVNDNGLFSNESAESDDGQPELLESLITWCYVEERKLNRHPQLRDALQDAFMQLFCHWTSTTTWKRFSDGKLYLLNHWLIDSLLEAGDNLVHHHKLRVYPWLLSEHYLHHITALDTVPHAAWTLWLSDSEHWRFNLPPIDIPTATRRRAVEMVEEWLMSPDATPEDLQLWDPVLIRHRERLYLFPDAP